MAETHVLRITLTHPEPQRADPTVFHRQPQRYIAQGAGGARGEAEFAWPEMLEELQAFASAQRDAMEKSLGDRLRRFLTEALKQLEGIGGLERELSEAEARQQPLQLVFSFDAVELFALPWSLLRLQNGQSLGAHPWCQLHFEWVGDEAPEAVPIRWERVLFAWSEAGRPVPYDRHREALKQAWPAFDPNRHELENVTLAKLQEALREADRRNEPVQILHILCHGVELRDGSFGLAWSAPAARGGVQQVTGQDLRRLIASHKNSLKMVVLNACHGADPGRGGRLFGGVAHDLHREGIPYVIASQMPLSLEGSGWMAAALYQALFQDKDSVHAAFKKAQEALLPRFQDWASLQLFGFSHALPESRRRALRRSRRLVFSGEDTLPELVSGDLAVAYEVNQRIPTTPVLKALASAVHPEPDIAVLNPLGKVQDALPGTAKEWKTAFREADHFVRALMDREAQRLQPVLHLFGCAPLPLMFHLGWLLARHPLRAYQQPAGRRDTWIRGYDSNEDCSGVERFLRTDAWPTPEACRAAGGRVAVTVEVSRRIQDNLLQQWLGESPHPALLRLFPPGEPGQEAVRCPADAARALLDFQEYLNRIHDTLPDVQEVWLALACPASFAAALGRAFNPKAQAPLRLFNFRNAVEGYEPVHALPVGVRKRNSRR
ncbi:SAVED domain-containing protein [Archangium violaceum]|uniref:SAVED domain-containing protein n=1 Tax=Archangium violaceum TaxID=83451 RepID=UPI0036DC9006